MSSLNTEGDHLLTPELIARNRAVLAAHTIRERLSIGQNIEVLQPVLSHLGGLLAHARLIPPAEGAEHMSFAHENPDKSYDFITIQPDSPEGDFLIWFHLIEYDSYLWRGHQMRMSSELREDNSYGILIAEVSTSNPVWVPKAKDNVDVRRVGKSWSFEVNGKIEGDLNDDVDLEKVPLIVFMPPQIDTTTQ